MTSFDQDSVKKLAVIAAASLLIFWLIKPSLDGKKDSFLPIGGGSKKSKYIKKPVLGNENEGDPFVLQAYDCLCAYIDAINNDESQATLDELNRGFNDMGFDVYKDNTGRLAVRDMDGQPIMTNVD